MSVLSRLKMRTKLALLIGFAVLAAVVTGGMAAKILHDQMVEDRLDKLQAVVEATSGLATVLNTKVLAGQMTREQAIAALGEQLHVMRFDDGDGYVTMQDRNGRILIHGSIPAREGQSTNVKASDGRSLTDIVAAALRDHTSGMVAYSFPKPGKKEPQSKVAYVAKFAPWDTVFLCGAYTDDLEDMFQAALVRLSTVGGVILVVTMLVAWLINRDITRSLGSLRQAMQRLAGGDLRLEVPGLSRGDELGEMAKAVQVFRSAMLRAEELSAEQVAERAKADADKQAALVNMAETIENETRLAMDQIGGRTSALAATAQNMSSSASRTGESAESAAQGAHQAMATAQTVASAAEQLSASIREISGQVAQSSAVVARAVSAGDETRETIQTLNVQVERIGAVADMIGEIAAKTNLLALNATIEAARAGDAGKGFAVVASEVKALANQTARSTEEIGRHIAEVRGATSASVAAVSRIEETISEINAIASSIAASVEEQGAATAEIARNVAETASAASLMSGRIGEVSEEAKDTGNRAAMVLENTSALNEAVLDLKHSVIRAVRTSTAEVERRASERYTLELGCNVTAGGRSSRAKLVDLSEGGARVQGASELTSGAHGTLSIDGCHQTLSFIVKDSADGTVGLAFTLDEAGKAAFKGVPERLARRQPLAA